MIPEKTCKTGPVSFFEFKTLMGSLGPFESKPHLAVAVSGGSDSLALTLLSKVWADNCGGSVTALSIDHGLRDDSTRELDQLAQWLSMRNIEHIVLRWTGIKPQTGIQKAARDERYRLLENWCRDSGVLHLLLGHNKEDQAETFLLRLNHKSGLDGLAGMASIVEKAHARLLRPLLSISKFRLQETLSIASQSWLEDPSNKNYKFERVRIRSLLPALEKVGLNSDTIADISLRIAEKRIDIETKTSQLLATSCSIFPEGYALLDGQSFFSTRDEISSRALSRILLCIGGTEYAPATSKLLSLYQKMKAAFNGMSPFWKGATLGRCRLMPAKGSKAMSFLVCREQRFLPAAIPVFPNMKCNWDNRFRISFKGINKETRRTKLQSLGHEGLLSLKATTSILDFGLPEPVVITLPSLVDDDGVITVPHLNFFRLSSSKNCIYFSKADFCPTHTLSGKGFIVAK